MSEEEFLPVNPDDDTENQRMVREAQDISNDLVTNRGFTREQADVCIAFLREAFFRGLRFGQGKK